MRETRRVATTHIELERNFAMLGRLMKLKLKAWDLVYEGTLLFVRNKTNACRDKLTEEELDKAITFEKKI